MRLSRADALLLADSLAVPYETAPICLACLTFASFPLRAGEEKAARRAICRLAREFWEDGLDVTIRAALDGAVERGVERALEGARDVEELGGRSELVRAIVHRLAEAQVAEMAEIRRIWSGWRFD